MTATKPSVIVLANCTHISIAAALSKSGEFDKVSSAELYSMGDDKRQETFNKIKDYEFILTLEHSDHFGPLATEKLKDHFGSKVFRIATPFFSGTVPEMAYLRYGGGAGAQRSRDG